MDAGSCNACSAAGTPLMKLSLGKRISSGAPTTGCPRLLIKVRNGTANPAP